MPGLITNYDIQMITFFPVGMPGQIRIEIPIGLDGDRKYRLGSLFIDKDRIRVSKIRSAFAGTLYDIELLGDHYDLVACSPDLKSEKNVLKSAHSLQSVRTSDLLFNTEDYVRFRETPNGEKPTFIHELKELDNKYTAGQSFSRLLIDEFAAVRNNRSKFTRKGNFLYGKDYIQIVTSGWEADRRSGAIAKHLSEVLDFGFTWVYDLHYEWVSKNGEPQKSAVSVFCPTEEIANQLHDLDANSRMCTDITKVVHKVRGTSEDLLSQEKADHRALLMPRIPNSMIKSNLRDQANSVYVSIPVGFDQKMRLVNGDILITKRDLQDSFVVQNGERTNQRIPGRYDVILRNTTYDIVVAEGDINGIVKHVPAKDVRDNVLAAKAYMNGYYQEKERLNGSPSGRFEPELEFLKKLGKRTGVKNLASKYGLTKMDQKKLQKKKVSYEGGIRPLADTSRIKD